MSQYSRTLDNESSAPPIYTALCVDDTEETMESTEDEVDLPIWSTYVQQKRRVVHAAENRLFNAHRNDIAMIISAQYEFQTFFLSDHLDTYIWLQVPNTHDAVKMACTGICFQSTWVLPYSSAALRRSGFTKFVELLDNERYQTRTYNRLAASGFLPPSDSSSLKRYYLDLGPSDDSDLHAEHLEALTLPQGVIRYSTMVANGEESVPIACAGGHDDACSCFQLKLARGAAANHAKDSSVNMNNEVEDNGEAASESAMETGQSTTPATVPQGEASEDATEVPAETENNNSVGSSTSFRRYTSNSNGNLPHSIWDAQLAPEYQIADYCEIRHICNVIRLLMAIAGRRLLLNSAARIYTLAGLAKLFGLVSSDGYYDGQVQMYSDYATFSNNFRGMISEWFYNPRNAKIVDILPEECFIMAWNLKLAPVTRAAFRIIVAESALYDTVNNGAMPHAPQSRRLTCFGRELSGLLDDDMENIVAYASSALVQRVLKLRDAIDEKVSILASNVHLDRLSVNVAGGSPVYDFAKDPLFKQAEEGVMYTLVGVADTLETFAFAEQTILSNCPHLHFMDTVKRPIHAAFMSVQAFMRHIAMIVVKSYRGTSADSSIAFPSMHHQNMKQCIRLYRRKRPNDDHGWLVQAYKQLSDNQRCMTTLYWKGLWSEIKNVHGKPAAERLTYTALLERMADLISEAVTPDPENARMGHTAEMQLRNVQQDLLSRLNNLGVFPDGETSDVKHTFEYNAVTPALRKLFSEPFLHFHDRAYFSPHIEMDALHASPHLMLSLTTDEFRFLPLWAGGNNDETGAVFQEALPVADLGPVGPGPAYHTGQTVASAASTAGADFNSSASASAGVTALSAAGPPSVSSDGVGSFEGFVDLRLGDAGTERAASIASGSTDYQAARDFADLDMQSQSRSSRNSGSISDSYVGDSAFDVTSSSATHSQPADCDLDMSSLAGERSTISSSNQSLTALSDVASSFIVVEDAPPRTADVPSTTTGVELDSSRNDGDFDFDDDDFDDFGDGFSGDDDEDDDADNMQEFIDDDNADARSDDTVMPDREEILESMRRGEARI